MSGDLVAAIDMAEKQALADHRSGACQDSQWSCSHCEIEQVDVTALIAAHTAGSAEALADSILRGAQHADPFPAPRPVPGPTHRDELVGSLFVGFRALGGSR